MQSTGKCNVRARASTQNQVLTSILQLFDITIYYFLIPFYPTISKNKVSKSLSYRFLGPIGVVETCKKKIAYPSRLHFPVRTCKVQYCKLS